MPLFLNGLFVLPWKTVRFLVPWPHYSVWPPRFGSRGPAVRPEYVTENHWPRRPGNTPYRGKQAMRTFTFVVCLKKNPSANPSQLQRILKCLAAANKPFQLTCRQFITNIWIYCIIVSLFCRFCSEQDIFAHLLPLFWNFETDKYFRDY